MAQRTGALVFDELTDRYDIRFDLSDYYGGLHCGDCLEVFVRGKWKPTRMEYGPVSYTHLDVYKRQPYYRVVVADSRYPRDGRFIEEIGTYNPCVSPAEIKIDADRAREWIKTGAQPTETVRALLKKVDVQ